MFKYFLLLMVSGTCFAFDSTPKFHFGDCVRVNRGFYKDCKGIVSNFYGFNAYGVNILNCKDESFSANFQDMDLELSKGCKNG